jgi:hypothetical protein
VTQLDNPRHERFCALVASGKSQTEAYQEVFGCAYNSARANGSTLVIANTDVQARIATLTAQLQRKTVLTLARKRELLNEMAEGKRPTRRVVMPDGGEKVTYDAVAPIELDAKLAGELESGNTGVTVTLSIEQQRAILPTIEAEATVERLDMAGNGQIKGE